MFSFAYFQPLRKFILLKTRSSENVLHNHFLLRALSEFRNLQIKLLFNHKYLAIAVSIYLIKVANYTFYLSALYTLRNVLLVKLTKLYTINFLFQPCTCSGMCLLLNWKIVHCELYVFSFSFVHAPVCANCNLFL